MGTRFPSSSWGLKREDNVETMCSLGPSKSRCEDGIKCARTLIVETPVKGNAEDVRRGWRADAKTDPE